MSIAEDEIDVDTRVGKWKPDSSSFPSNWNLQRLKFISNVYPSNVDKKSREEEVDVKLCNYTDVYYNEYIDGSIDFMDSTATENEIHRFELSPGDILLTKDSEDWQDIGVPAFVSEDLDSVLCGYHLFLCRPNESKVQPEYLFWALSSGFTRFQLEGAATGVTRYGLNTQDIACAWIPIPSLQVQQKITEFLNQNTKHITNLIQRKERLIELLEEKREAIVTRAVTSGIDPNVEMVDSGIPWFGEVPAHWKVSKVKFEFQNKDNDRIPVSASNREKMQGEYPYYGASGIIDFVDDYLFKGPHILIGEDGANLLSRTKRLSFIADGEFWVNNHAHILKPREGDIWYFSELLEVVDYSNEVRGAAQPKLTAKDLGDKRVLVPPLEEQEAIKREIKPKIEDISEAIGLLKESIDLLKEKQEALVTKVITGNTDVINWEQLMEREAEL